MSERPSSSPQQAHVVIAAAQGDEHTALKLWQALQKIGVTASLNDAHVFKGEATHLLAVLSGESPESLDLAAQIGAFREHSGGEVWTVRRAEHAGLPGILGSERGETGFLVPVAPPRDFGLIKDDAGHIKSAAVAISAALGVTAPSFVQRHGMSLAASALAGCLCLALWFNGLTLQRAQQAETQIAQATRLGDDLLAALASGFPTSADSESSLALGNQIDQALAAVPLSEADPEALSRYAAIYHAIGEIRDLHGAPQDAQSAFERAHKFTGHALTINPADPEAIFAHSQSAFWAGNSAYRAGDLQSAQTHFGAYAELAQQLVEIDPDNVLYVAERGHAANNSGVIALERGEAEDAAAFFETAIITFEGSPLSEGYVSASDIANTRGWRADALMALGQLSASVHDRLLEAASYEAALGASPDDAELIWALANARYRAAMVMAQQGLNAEADATLEPALIAASQLIADHPQNIRYARLYVAALRERARIAFWNGESYRAQLLLGEAQRYIARVGSAGQNDNRHIDRGYVSLLGAEIALHAGASADARSDATEAILAGEQAILAGFESARSLLALAYFTHGEALRMSGDEDAASRSYRAAQTNIAALPSAASNLAFQDLLARAHWRLSEREPAISIRERLSELSYARSDFAAFWAGEDAALNANNANTNNEGDDRG